MIPKKRVKERHYSAQEGKDFKIFFNSLNELIKVKKKSNLVLKPQMLSIWKTH